MYGLSGIILSVTRQKYADGLSPFKEFLTQSPAKFDEKTCVNPYVDRF